MEGLRKILNYSLSVLAGISFLAMVGLTCWQVFTRYILQNPSSWSEEMVSYLFAWMSLFGASIVVGIHIAESVVAHSMATGLEELSLHTIHIVGTSLGHATLEYDILLARVEWEVMSYRHLGQRSHADGNLR